MLAISVLEAGRCTGDGALPYLFLFFLFITLIHDIRSSL